MDEHPRVWICVFFWLLALTLIVVGLVCQTIALHPDASGFLHPPETIAGSSVRIETSTGLGSGVYIGGGVIITAAHVVDDNPTVKLVSDAGDVQDGTVLWVNKTYDIAAIRPDNSKRFLAANLACRDPIVGETIMAEGNPMGLKFLSFKGSISGAAREFLPKWKSAYVIDVTIASGMSGGPSYDEFGEVIGINVGVADPHGSAGQAAAGGMGFTVPSMAVCQLLGRAA